MKIITVKFCIYQNLIKRSNPSLCSNHIQKIQLPVSEVLPVQAKIMTLYLPELANISRIGKNFLFGVVTWTELGLIRDSRV